MSHPGDTLRREVQAILAAAGLTSDGARVQVLTETGEDGVPSAQQCPAVWVDCDGAPPAWRALTQQTATAEVTLLISCWVAMSQPGRDPRLRANDLFAAVRAAISASETLGASLGVMPLSWTWGGGEYEEGASVAGVMAALTFTVNPSVNA